ncbi:hypothetical protein [Aeromonas salmonicida]|uniref:hypothetical protein n=1 Tax=Aeromonas salmonicida TaxID=645 RepID=UPI00073B8DD0|nr:hypothetical protein [Aeromonas salmonicida]KTA76220.1 hypothetical protein VO70_21580 [Aeromonas salmonicida]
MTIEEAIANNIGSVITGTVAILSACITTGVAVWISSVNHNRGVEEAKRKESIERLEILYINFENWSSSLLRIYLNISFQFKGVATAEETIKSVGNMKEKPIDYIALINTKVNLHHRNLLPLFEKVSAQQLKVGRFLQGERKESLLNKFIDEQEKFDEICNEFKNAIVEEMNNLTK